MTVRVEFTGFVAGTVEQPAFVTTESAYREFVQAARLRPLIATQVRRLREGADLIAVGAFIRTAYFEAQMPAALAEAIVAAYRDLAGADGEVVIGGVSTDDRVDEFLSAPHEIFVGVKGERAVLAAVKRCWGSLFTDRAIVYREVRGIDHLAVDLVVRVESIDALSSADPVLQHASAS
jgi:phosphoenolpyruvate synthase/pyruvate phosphate dikinase